MGREKTVTSQPGRTILTSHQQQYLCSRLLDQPTKLHPSMLKDIEQI